MTQESVSQPRANELYDQHRHTLHCATDRMFGVLLMVQWVAAILLAWFVSPYTWAGASSSVHQHVYFALTLGTLLTAWPTFLVLYCPGHAITRYSIAAAQAGWSALLIHLSGGRLETHFHIFGSLAMLAFYRDWKVLMIATVVTAADHFVRGLWWPQSVFGVFSDNPFRWLEHAAWVLFEDFFLLLSCRRSLKETHELCDRQAELEFHNSQMETTIENRTAELREHGQFLRSILDSLDASICILDSTGRVVEVNAGWIDYAAHNGGGTASTGIGSNYVQICRSTTGECRPGALAIADAIHAITNGSKESFTAEYPCHSPTQNQWFQVRISPLNGRGVGAVVVAHIDITDRVSANENLQVKTDEAELLALVARYTDNAVVITDRQSKIEWVNDGFTRITGYTLDEVRGRIPGQFLQGPDTNPATVATIRAAIARGEGFEVELVNYAKDKTPYWLAIEAQPILDENGEVSRFIAIESDISQRKQHFQEREHLQQELVAASRQAGIAEMATGVLHNVGNVLNSVNVSANLVAERLKQSAISSLQRACSLIDLHSDDLATFVTTDKQGRHLPDFIQQITQALSKENTEFQDEVASLLRNVEHVKEIVAIQQSLARPSAVRIEVCPSELMEDALGAIDGSICRHKITLVKDFADIPMINTDKHQVLQILINLLTNAKQAITAFDGSNSQLILRTGIQDEHTIFCEVEDTGHGIAPEDIGKVFQHGYTTRQSGHGFGLHNCANTATQLNGRLTAHSDGVGLGARFRLELPMVLASSQATSQKPDRSSDPLTVA